VRSPTHPFTDTSALSPLHFAGTVSAKFASILRLRQLQSRTLVIKGLGFGYPLVNCICSDCSISLSQL
jgi:hypothetical protein